MQLDEKSSHYEDSHAEFLKVYFSFGYYLGIIPYKFALECKDGWKHHRTHGYFINKIFCALVHIGTFFQIIGAFRKELLSNVPEAGSPQTLTYYFSLAFRLCSIPYYGCYFFLFWKNPKPMTDLLDDVDAVPSLLETRHKLGKVQVKTRATSICSLFTFLAILSLIMRFKSVSPKWDFLEILGAYAHSGKFNFFLVSNGTGVLPPEELDFGTTSLALIYMVIRYYSFVNGFFSDLLILMFALTFRSITLKFSECVDAPNKNSLNFMINKHARLKHTARKINDIIGFTYSFGLLVTYPVNIVYFGTLADTEDDWFAIFSNLFFAVNFVIVMLIASHAVENVGKLAKFLKSNENQKLMSEIDFIVIMDDLRNFPFGLQGRGLAVVTYRYVRKILTNFLSYTLLLILFQYTRMTSIKACNGCCDPTKHGPVDFLQL